MFLLLRSFEGLKYTGDPIARKIGRSKSFLLICEVQKTLTSSCVWRSNLKPALKLLNLSDKRQLIIVKARTQQHTLLEHALRMPCYVKSVKDYVLYIPPHGKKKQVSSQNYICSVLSVLGKLLIGGSDDAANPNFFVCLYIKHPVTELNKTYKWNLN